LDRLRQHDRLLQRHARTRRALGEAALEQAIPFSGTTIATTTWTASAGMRPSPKCGCFCSKRGAVRWRQPRHSRGVRGVTARGFVTQSFRSGIVDTMAGGCWTLAAVCRKRAFS